MTPKKGRRRRKKTSPILFFFGVFPSSFYLRRWFYFSLLWGGGFFYFVWYFSISRPNSFTWIDRQTIVYDSTCCGLFFVPFFAFLYGAMIWVTFAIETNSNRLIDPVPVGSNSTSWFQLYQLGLVFCEIYASFQLEL